MASKTVQLYQDDNKTVKEYPVTLTKAVYDDDENRLDTMIGDIDNISTIGDGSISGAISSVNSSLEKSNNQFLHFGNDATWAAIQAFNQHEQNISRLQVDAETKKAYVFNSSDGGQSFSGGALATSEDLNWKTAVEGATATSGTESRICSNVPVTAKEVIIYTTVTGITYKSTFLITRDGTYSVPLGSGSIALQWVGTNINFIQGESGRTYGFTVQYR